MKRIILFFTLLASSSFVLAQITVTEIKDENDTNRIYSKVDIEAGFPGGDSAWRNYLRKNLKPQVTVEHGAKAGTYKVMVRFIVSKDGSLSDIYCLEDPGFGICEEAKRIIKKTKTRMPALVNGHKVNAYRTQLFTFVVEKEF